MSVIYIRDLVITAKHGVHQVEKQRPQRFYIQLELAVDTAKAATSDDLADTLNYSGVRATVIDTVQNNSFNLIEHLGHEIAHRLLASDRRIENVQLSIEKLDVFDSGVPGVRLEVNRQG